MLGYCCSVQLLSLLLEALSCPDRGVQLSTLSCLQPVLVDPPSALIQQLEALVSRLLTLTTSPAMVSVCVCVCVFAFCKLFVSDLCSMF